MKKLIKYFIYSGALLFCTANISCSNSLLDEKLYNNLGASNLPKDASGLEQLILGIYTNLYCEQYNYFVREAGDAASDAMFINWGGIPETGWAGQMNFLTLDSNHSGVINAWNQAYKIIAQCNEAIRLFSGNTDSKVQELLAEATFWRSYCYYQLGLIYGNAPLVLEDTDLTNGCPQSTREVLYQFIIDELSGIEEMLPSSRASSEWGRVTKWTVKSLLSNLYLNQKNWQKASDYAYDIITNGGFSLMDNFEDVFNVEENSEIIQAIGCVGEYYRGNNTVGLSMEAELVKGLGLKGVSASNGLGMSIPFFNTYDPNDKRIRAYDPKTKKGIAIYGYQYNVNDGTSIYKDENGNPLKSEDVNNRVIILKYAVQENAQNGEWQTQDIVMYRLAEIFLTYAEAQNELGNSIEALKYINLIRARAGLNNLSSDLSKEQIRDAVLDERGWELFMEGFRRHDLIRHGKLLEKVKIKWDYYLDTPCSIINDTFRYLYPIPSSAMILNPQLKQNEGYSVSE